MAQEWDERGNLIREEWDEQGNPVSATASESGTPPQDGPLSFLSGLSSGTGKGIASTAFGAAEAMNSLLRLIPQLRGVVPEFPEKPEALNPQGTAEGIGYGAEQIGEFLLPGGAVAKGASKLPRLGRAARPLLEAASAGGVTALQTGGDVDTAALAAGAAGGITGAGTLAAPLARKAAVRIVESQIKGTLRNYESGFKAENVFKYDVGGSLEQMALKAANAIRERAGHLANRLRGNPGTVDIVDAIIATEKDLLGSASSKAKNVGSLKDIRASLARWVDEVAEVAPSGNADLLTATEIKRRVGLDGAWKYGKGTREAEADEKVANALYTHLRLGIERSARDPSIRQLNKELSELLPIEAAVVRRLPIDSRQNMISLVTSIASIPAMMGGGTGLLALPGIYAASKSTRIADIMQRLAQRGASGTTGRVAASAISQGNR